MAEQPKTRRVRIEHTGGPSTQNTRVTDAETGELIRFVTRVEFVADAGGVVSATLFLHAPELDVTVDTRIDERSQEERIADLVVERLAPVLRAANVHLPTVGPFFTVPEE